LDVANDRCADVQAQWLVAVECVTGNVVSASACQFDIHDLREGQELASAADLHLARHAWPVIEQGRDDGH
jgi:hypothetical protein